MIFQSLILYFNSIRFINSVKRNNLKQVKHACSYLSNYQINNLCCKYDLLNIIINNNNSDMLNFLINKKVNFINYNYSKNIIKYNKIEIIKLLLNIININDQVFDGYSIIYWCIYYNNQVLFKYLLTCSDLDISKYDRYKCSPLYWISYRNNIELLKILHISDIKINVNIANEFNVVPLHWAVINNNLEMVKLLIEMGADVNITNKLNSTSLYYAVRNQNIDIIKYLKNHNAITNIIKDNETIVEYAKHLKNQNIINLIEN